MASREDSNPALGKSPRIDLAKEVTDNENCVKGLFQELQSKWIYRVAGGYIVSAWVILQVAAIVFPSLEFPEPHVRASPKCFHHQSIQHASSPSFSRRKHTMA